MIVVKTPNETPKLPDVYRIVQYPDKSSKSGRVFFVDKKVRKRFLLFFYRTIWETVKWTNGESIHWFDFDKCSSDVAKLKQGEKLYE